MARCGFALLALLDLTGEDALSFYQASRLRLIAKDKFVNLN